MIAFLGVGFSYGSQPVLTDVTGDIHPGESVALAGENGAGKTTLTRLIVGLERPATGKVLVMGHAPKDPAHLARHVGYVFQHPARQLFARTVLADVTFGARQLGSPPDLAERAARANLERVNLAARALVHPHDLPPGEQKLVALAAALTQNPDILVLDEPTQGLDRPAMYLVAAIVREHVERGGVALSITHDAAFALEAADEIWHLAGGRIGRRGKTEEVFENETSAGGVGLSLPPVADLANRMSWPPECRRARFATREVQGVMGSG